MPFGNVDYSSLDRLRRELQAGIQGYEENSALKMKFAQQEAETNRLATLTNTAADVYKRTATDDPRKLNAELSNVRSAATLYGGEAGKSWAGTLKDVSTTPTLQGTDTVAGAYQTQKVAKYGFPGGAVTSMQNVGTPERTGLSPNEAAVDEDRKKRLDMQNQHANDLMKWRQTERDLKLGGTGLIYTKNQDGSYALKPNTSTAIVQRESVNLNNALSKAQSLLQNQIFLDNGMVSERQQKLQQSADEIQMKLEALKPKAAAPAGGEKSKLKGKIKLSDAKSQWGDAVSGYSDEELRKYITENGYEVE